MQTSFFSTKNSTQNCSGDCSRCFKKHGRCLEEDEAILEEAA